MILLHPTKNCIRLKKLNMVNYHTPMLNALNHKTNHLQEQIHNM
uniref:Uncharacterized protein n=1 Tax=Rhizophora mucronata TaxID=61149 RepID=A0A2P2LP76_RHIMU